MCQTWHFQKSLSVPRPAIAVGRGLLQSINQYPEDFLRRWFQGILKYSGHLSLLSRIQHKNAVLGFYQLAEYVERVLNQNNAIYADAVTLYLIDNGMTDFGNISDSLNAASQSFALDAEPHSGSEEIIFRNYQNKEMTLGLHNKLAIRGRSSSVHIDLLNRLQSEGESVIELLSN